MHRCHAVVGACPQQEMYGFGRLYILILSKGLPDLHPHARLEIEACVLLCLLLSVLYRLILFTINASMNNQTVALYGSRMT